MGELFDKIKTFVTFVLVFIAASTVAILLIMGPKDAADYLKWIGGIGSDAGQSGKEFIGEMKNK